MHSAGLFPTPATTKVEYTARKDDDLVAAVRSGSDVAFAELRKLYSNRLYKRILSITRNHEDAEDALQDTFMRVFLALGTFQGRSHLSTWLTRIAINSALMVIRRRCRAYAQVSFTPPLDSEADSHEFEIPDSAPTPEEICDWRQRSDTMFMAIDRLHPTLRNAIEIQITQGCSLKEMAQTLDVSVAAVKARLHRARKKIAQHLAHRGLKRNSQKHMWLNSELGRDMPQLRSAQLHAIL